MGFNIYEDTMQTNVIPRSQSERGTDKEVAERAFQQHAKGDLVTPGTAFHNLCQTLADAYPQLSNLTVPQIEGRVWEFLDADKDGSISLEEFLAGIGELLKPTTEMAKALMARMDAGPAPRMSTADYKHVKRVGIVGGGVAGLQVANCLRQVGIQSVIYEKCADIGGVWRENYADFGLQVPRDLYEFPGFPWPNRTPNWDWFPKGEQVQEYIQRYAKEFDLYSICKFETAVLEVTPKGDTRGWSVKYQTKGKDAEVDEFDFLVVATGMYTWPPHIPVARGAEKFKGEILHSSSFVKREQAAGKKVVVIGGGKSAIDNVVAASNGGAQSATLLCRETHWPVPRYLAYLIPFKYATYSRFGHSLLPVHHEEKACSWWCHNLLAPIKWLVWRIVELLFMCQFCISRKFAPESKIEIDLFGGGQILNYDFMQKLREGKCEQVKGSISYYKEESVVCTDGTELQADLVIYGTGFTKRYDIFDSTFVQPKLGLEKDGLWLYRSMISPKVDDLAFVGSEVSTFNNILTHGLQALWLQKLLINEVALPKPRVMEKAIEDEKAWKRSWMPPSSARASLWQLHMTKYHDNLVKDIGENYWRKGAICCPCEVLCPYRASDYHSLFHLERKSSPSAVNADTAPLMVEMKEGAAPKQGP